MTDITLEHYSAYESLKLRRHPNGVLELIMGSKDGKPGKLSTYIRYPQFRKRRCFLPFFFRP